ncbi:unnamed protein product [Enterobius vermicularis]|uniref:Gamma-tubulin complex component n=1 Tax=Enterobius vermicularis TaxID=51028 RepID=A0A0N4VKV9_ENTVE|nr:unnamed protein product [Enterobius vermicularis]
MILLIGQLILVQKKAYVLGFTLMVAFNWLLYLSCYSTISQVSCILRLSTSQQILNDLSRGRVALAVAVTAGEFLRNEVLTTVRNLEMDMREEKQMLNIFTVTTRMRPFLQTVKKLVVVFSKLCKSEMVGGEILTYLCEEAKLCVLPDTTAILLKLEQVGLKHYLGFVFSWICYGTLTEDYYHEFMVWDLSRTGCFEKHQVLEDAELANVVFDGLEEKFCVVSGLCPSQLLDVYTDIVNCGKYVRIMQSLDAGRESFDDRFVDGNVLQSWEDKSVESVKQEIKEIRCRFSRLLVLQLKKTFKMELLLEAFHDFFFLKYPDWLNQFFDLTENIFSHPVDSIMAKKVQFYFEEAVNSSCLETLDFRNLFRISFDKCDVFTLFLSIINLTVPPIQDTSGKSSELVPSGQPDGVLQGYRVDRQLRDGLVGAAALSLTVDLQSPMTLMFSSRMLLNYELVFRTLFCVHRTRRLLYGKYVLEDLLGEERALLRSMLFVLHEYFSHCVSDVIPKYSKAFLSKVAESASLEEIIAHHSTLFDEIFEKCFLADSEFVANLSDIIETITGYSTDVYTFDRTASRWKSLRERLYGILSKRANSNTYSQLHMR